MNTPEHYAKELWQARNTGNFCQPITESLTLDTAYDIQDACTAHATDGDTVIGYKIGATADETLGILGLTEPFYGALYKSSYTVITEPEQSLTLNLFMQHQPRIECEFVACMKNDIHRTNKDLTIEDIKEHIDWIAPGLEIVGSRFNDTAKQLGYRAIADLGANQHMLVGKPYSRWQELDLSAHPVQLNIEGQETVNGHSGISIYGNPLEFVCWLLNQQRMHTVGLKAGQIVSCGTCTGAPFLEAGKQVVADYGVLGKLKLDIRAQSAS